MRLIDADHLRRWIIKRGLEYQLHPADILDQVDREPTIEPERKTGKWIKISPAGIYECSECGQNVMTNDIVAYRWCHGCGAEMEGEQDE